MDIKELAEHAQSFFETKTRAGSDEHFISMTRRRPTWIYNMVHHIHDDGQIFPDDYKYDYIDTALDLLADGVDPENPTLEPDPYDHDLIKWLGSHSVRVAYVDDAVGDMGHSDRGIMGDIAWGQWREKEEVFRMVVDALEKRLEEIEEGIEEEFKDDPPKGVKEWWPR